MPSSGDEWGLAHIPWTEGDKYGTPLLVREGLAHTPVDGGGFGAPTRGKGRDNAHPRGKGGMAPSPENRGGRVPFP